MLRFALLCAGLYVCFRRRPAPLCDRCGLAYCPGADRCSVAAVVIVYAADPLAPWRRAGIEQLTEGL
jgi:hypothetical protein